MRNISARLLAVIVLLTSPLLLRAQPLADRVPGDAMIYAGWTGADSLPPSYQQSHLKSVLDNSKIRELFTEMLPQVLRRIEAQDRNAANQIEMVRLLLSQAWTHPSAIYFGGLDMTNPRQPMPKVAMICQAGNDSQGMLQRLTQIVAMMPRNPAVRVGQVDDLVVVSIGYRTSAQAVVAAGGASLQQSAGFSAAMKQMHNDSVMAGFIDIDQLLAMVESLINVEPANPQVKAMAPKIIDALGIRGLKRAVFSAGFDGRDWSEECFIDAPAPRSGILAAMDSKPVSDDLLKTIPVDATFAASVRFDPAKFITTLRTVAGQVDPQAQRVVDQGLGAVQLALAKNPVTDVLEPLGKDWAIYCSPSVSGNGVLGLVVVNKLDDPAKAASSLPTAWINLSNWGAVALNRARAEVEITGRSIESDGARIYYIGSPIVAPAWAIKGDYLVAGLYPQPVSSGLRHLAAPSGKSLLDNEQFKALQKRVGVTNPTGFSFYNLPVTAADGSSYQQLLVLARYAGFGDLFGIPLPEPLLPPLDLLQKDLAPAGTFDWIDDAGFHSRSISPFPGARVFSEPGMFSGAAPATGALMAAILLPSLNRARETANRVKCGANLRSIGQACLLYANEHQGRLPDSLGELIKTEDITIDCFVCPSSDNKVPPDVIAGGPDAMVAWVNDNSDYVYRGAGKKFADLGAEAVLVYEKPEDHNGDGMNLLFGDGHVEFENMPMATQLLERQSATGARGGK